VETEEEVSEPKRIAGMTAAEIDKAWEDLLWARHFVNRWRFICVLCYVCGLMLGLGVGLVIR